MPLPLSPVQFALSLCKLQDIIDAVNNDTSLPNTNMSVVVTIGYRQDPATHQFVIFASVAGAKGEANNDGRIPELEATRRHMCPHPPPCRTDAHGLIEKDDDGNMRVDSTIPGFVDCYDFNCEQP